MSKPKIFYENDVTTTILKDKTIGIIGYGIQGHAQALNLRDSGYKVILGLRPDGFYDGFYDASVDRATKEGFQVFDVPEASKRADVIHILIPDMEQPQTYQDAIRPHLKPGKTLGFSHGFNIHFQRIKPPKNVDVIMIAPKSPGKRVRDLYVEGFGVPSLIAVHQDYTGHALQTALEMAHGLHSTKAGVLLTSFKAETESDLIGEQTVLVGGLIELIKNAFEVLVEEGYPPELSYFEACNEAKLIMDLIYEKGITGMLNGVSVTARYGGLTIGPKIIDKHVKEKMRQAARNVKNGKFAKLWVEEYEKGSPNLKRLMKAIEKHRIEKVGEFVRKISGVK